MSATPPEDEDGAARLAADESLGEGARRQAFACLVPTIETVARRVSCRFGGQWRNDVIADAAGDVWAAITSFPANGSFEPWCYTVLRNRWLDSVRREQGQQRIAARTATAPRTEPVLRSAVERALDAQEDFGPEDLRQIADWTPRERLVLLSLSGLWRKVPHPEWARWIAEHRACFGLPDPVSFPPDALSDCDTLRKRNEVLAGALRLKRNTLSVLLYRGKERLRALRYVRDRLDGGFEPK